LALQTYSALHPPNATSAEVWGAAVGPLLLPLGQVITALLVPCDGFHCVFI